MLADKPCMERRTPQARLDIGDYRITDYRLRKEGIVGSLCFECWLSDAGESAIPESLVSENFVLGSLAVLLGERVLAPMRRVVAKEALTQTAAACEIAPLVLGPEIGDVAALMAALSPVVKKSLESNRA